MKIIEAINRIDSLIHNTYSQNDKVIWLSEVDGKVKRLILDTHEKDKTVSIEKSGAALGGVTGSDSVLEGIGSFSGYGPHTDTGTELLIPEPFSKAYLFWMEAQIHYYNGEYDKYNNAIDMYNTEFTAYKNHYNRTHTPKGTKMKFF